MAAFSRVTKRPIRVVQIGCGSMAQGWVARAGSRPDVEIVGLVDIRREAAEQTAAKHKLPASVVFNTLKEALATARPDAVFDITVPTAHYHVTMEALAAGCHVLGEKPLADTLPRARRMCAAARKARRLYMVTQNRRYIPSIVAFSQTVKGGTIGKLSSLDADFYIGAHFGGFRDVMPHVLLLDMAIHSFDQARFISGCDPQSVYCHEYNPHGSWYKSDAAAICIFEMTNRMVFSYRGSWAAEGFNTPWECAWGAVGPNGTILWDGAAQPKVQIPTGKGSFFRPARNIKAPVVKLSHAGHEGILDDFIHALRTGVAPQTECNDNIKSLAMCLAAVESAKKGKRVPIKC